MDTRLFRLGLVAVVIAALTLMGCDSPTAPSPPNDPPVQNNPQPTPGPISLRLTCNGSPGTCSIELGAGAELAWTSTNATACTLNPGGFTGLNEIRNTGSLVSSRDYSLRCTNSAGEQTATIRVNVSPMLGGPGTPYIEIGFHPKVGGNELMRGRLIHAIPADYQLAVYIRVRNGWWTKPYFNQPLTPIAPDASWSVSITTGGFDTTATEIVVFLVTKNHQPKLAGGDGYIPISVNGRDVLSVVRISR